MVNIHVLANAHCAFFFYSLVHLQSMFENFAMNNIKRKQLSACTCLSDAYRVNQWLKTLFRSYVKINVCNVVHAFCQCIYTL